MVHEKTQKGLKRFKNIFFWGLKNIIRVIAFVMLSNKEWF